MFVGFLVGIAMTFTSGLLASNGIGIEKDVAIYNCLLKGGVEDISATETRCYDGTIFHKK